MIISEIYITRIRPLNGLVAFASFTLWESIRCTSVAIFARPTGGFRLAYPTKKFDGKNNHIVYPINKEIGSMIESAVVGAYIETCKENHD